MYGPLRNFPMGLGGLFAAPPDPSTAIEDRVKDVQDAAVKWLEGRSELYRQAVYQYLYGLGHRIPQGSPHDNLRRLAKKEQS